MSDANDCSGAGGSGTNDGSETWSLILPLLIAALGALLLWMAAIVLLKHEIADEFDIMRRRVFGPANVDICKMGTVPAGCPISALRTYLTEVGLMRVAVLSYPMLFQRKGGLQIQVLETIDALKLLGVDARLVDPNVERFSGFDVIHVFSAINGNHRIVETAKSQGRPVVLSPLIRPSWTQSSGRLGAFLEQLVGKLSGWHVQTTYSHISSALANADKIVALGEIERVSIKNAFGEVGDKIRVIPNGINKRFYCAEPEGFIEKYGIKSGFVLNVAGVNKHKNQSAIVHALKDCKLPIVLIGWCQNEDGPYLASLIENSNVIFLGPLSYDDPLLSSAYAAAGVFVLPSYDEVMPLSIMEALAAGTPVVMTNRHSMRLENHSAVVRQHDPTDGDSIRDSILYFLDSPPEPNMCKQVVQAYTWESVAKGLLATYEQAIDCAEKQSSRIA